MSKHDHTDAFFAGASAIQTQEFQSIGEVFALWKQASEIAFDRTQSTHAQADALRRMEHLWDAKLGLPVQSASDMAALFIMANETPSVDADTYMESAWRIVSFDNGEAELTGLYAVWRTLWDTINGAGLEEATADRLGEICNGLEAQMAAIPATTAKALAIKVDVFRDCACGVAGHASLTADLAALTGQEVRPD